MNMHGSILYYSTSFTSSFVSTFLSYHWFFESVMCVCGIAFRASLNTSDETLTATTINFPKNISICISNFSEPHSFNFSKNTCMFTRAFLLV